MYIFEFLNSKCHRRNKTKYPNVINEKIIGKNSNLNLVILSYNIFNKDRVVLNKIQKKIQLRKDFYKIISNTQTISDIAHLIVIYL